MGREKTSPVHPGPSARCSHAPLAPARQNFTLDAQGVRRSEASVLLKHAEHAKGPVARPQCGADDRFRDRSRLRFEVGPEHPHRGGGGGRIRTLSGVGGGHQSRFSGTCRAGNSRSVWVWSFFSGVVGGGRFNRDHRFRDRSRMSCFVSPMAM